MASVDKARVLAGGIGLLVASGLAIMALGASGALDGARTAAVSEPFVQQSGPGGASTSDEAPGAASPEAAPQTASADPIPPMEEGIDLDEVRAIPAGIGDPAIDDIFQFLVTAVDCEARQVGEGGATLTAGDGNRFCLVDVDITNVSEEPEQATSAGHIIHDTAGGQYYSDARAETAIPGNEDVWYDEIPPGGVISGRILFEVSEDAELVKLTMVAAGLSNGVDIRLI